MEESNEETVRTDTEPVPKDPDPDTPLKKGSEEDVKSPQKNIDVSSSETQAVENIPSANGIDSESVSGGEPQTSIDICQSQENVIQSEETPTILSDKSNESSAVSEKLDSSSKELSSSSSSSSSGSGGNNNNTEETCKEINEENNISVDSKEIDNIVTSSSDGEQKEEEVPPAEKEELSVSESKNVGCEAEKVEDLNEHNESSANLSKVEGNEVEDCLNKEKEPKVEEKAISSEEKVCGDLGEPKDVKESDQSENIENKEVEDEDDQSRVSPVVVESEGKDEKKPEEEDKKQSSSDSEVERDNLDFQNKNDSIQESCSSQSIINTSGASAEQDEENTNRSENDGNEIMDTEIVNCNEIEQIDFSESDSQKDKEIDRIGIEPHEADTKGENKDEEMYTDLLETCEDKREDGETQTDVIAIDGEANNQPGNSEEETITGDTSTQTTADLQKGKDEEVCIIPDDMIPRLSIPPQNKETRSEGEVVKKLEFKILRVSTPEMEKPKTRLQDKKNEETKMRPVRNAAKLAGNKIKSLVENDLVLEEQSRSDEIQENASESTQICAQCREVKVCKFVVVHGDSSQYLCSEQCSTAFKAAQMDAEPTEMDNSLGETIRKCAQCHSQMTIDERCLFWETMDFCNEDCLGKYQTELGSNCANCKGSVASSSLGKYCVRFGYDVKQFCCAACLEEYKKGLKVCSYCQKDISTGAEGFLAPVGDKGQFKDFCTQSCMEKYERMSSNVPPPDVIEECAVCSNSKPVRVEVQLDNKTHKLCSEPCFAAFKFVNNITEGQCDMCRTYFDRTKTPSFSLFYDDSPRTFCCKTCMNVYILANRKIVPCNWCKVKKYNFDMIKKVSANGQLTMMCSLNCFMLYQVSVNAVYTRRIKCDCCMTMSQPHYHLTMSDATIRNFCSYNCVMSFQNRYPKQNIDVIPGSDQLSSPIPTGGPKRATPRRSQQVDSSCVPVISSVQSLASPNGPASPTGRVTIPRADLVPQVAIPTTVAPMPAPPPQVYQQIITKPPPAKQMKNKSVLCKPYSHTKGVSCRPHPCMKETQTDQSLNRKFLIPIPIPIYVPAPMHMFATPFPVPVPFPLPIPVPVFIPTTRNSAKGIFKEIKKIQEKIPTDPFEAELLMMAEMVAEDKKQDPTDSESEDGDDGDGGDGTFSPENVDTSNTFGDDMLQMALKMASELEEPAVDMESVLTSNTITTTTQPAVDPNKALYDQVHVMAMNRGRKRSVRGARNSTGGTPSKRGRRTSGSVDAPLLPPPEPVPPPRIEVEKPDANMCLKYTFGVNAWRHWVMQKNAELEKAALTNRKIKLFKPELLQLTSDELNFSLCLFVKEVRKPNGTEYAPDTIYYLCLGIQQYLFENGRIDNIFTDSYYEKFTDCLDEVAKKFAALYSDSQYIVTRVEEEHLWESKQLGAHSPHVLLSTLMFFNTKHFNLVTVEEHMQLSFSHIMKHWKRNPNTPGVAKIPGSRNVLLRFYPPQSALEANSRKKKVYEQQENEENPLRCPVKLYEFYLSKCPESVKTRNDVFYLLPERSCVPDSPVWYSTMALGKEPLMKMLHRVKMVKEINIALLSC